MCAVVASLSDHILKYIAVLAKRDCYDDVW
jgi:hypothetical protein